MRAEDVKRALGKRVKFTSPKLFPEGADYVLTGAVLRHSIERGYFYQAELTDITTKNSVIYCGLEEVEVEK